MWGYLGVRARTLTRHRLRARARDSGSYSVFYSLTNQICSHTRHPRFSLSLPLLTPLSTPPPVYPMRFNSAAVCLKLPRRPGLVECCPCFPSTHRTRDTSSLRVIYGARCPSDDDKWILLKYIYTSAINTFSKLLQPGRHQLIRLLAALLASAPLALVLADARPPALLALAPPAMVLADARPPALLASAPLALVLADARPPALLACAPLALVLADARPPALLASAPLALVLADARTPALLACAPDALVLAPLAMVLADVPTPCPSDENRQTPLE